jgi:CheY-like chemotaxis protein
MMGGNLKVESAPGVGSKFSFEVHFDTLNAPVSDYTDKIVFNEIKKPTFKGEVLVCEDNHMNRQVISDNLEKVGLKTVLAHNGKEGLDIVAQRMESGEKPFDLIFMDIHMPVMDGLEAASKIAALGVQTPIVALTANILINDLELYTQSGMSGHLGKPFTSQELWRCLATHLSPEKPEHEVSRDTDADDELLQHRIKLLFVKSNQHTFAEFQKALAKKNIKLAHRLVHTLKSNAAHIGEERLREAAATAEGMLLNGKNLLTDEQGYILETELAAVLEKLSPLLDEAEETLEVYTADSDQAAEVFAKLEPMLLNSNPECVNLLDNLQRIAGTRDLARHIMDFDFEKAIDAFRKIMETRGHINGRG